MFQDTYFVQISDNIAGGRKVIKHSSSHNEIIIYGIISIIM